MEITTRARNLGYGSSSEPSGSGVRAPETPSVTGGVATIREALASDRRAYGNHELGSGHNGTWWRARLFVGGVAVQERVADVLADLDSYGRATVTLVEP